MNTIATRQHTELKRPSVSFSPARIGDFRNGLVVRMPNHLGDAVMALPALAALKGIIPEHCGLFVVTPAGIAQLYQALPMVDDIIPLAQPHRFWSKDELRQVRQLHPGAAVLFNHSLRDALCFKAAGVGELYGEPTRGRGFLLEGSFPFPRREKGQYSPSHQTMRYLAIAEALGGHAVEGFMPEIVIPCAADELHGPAASLFYHPLLLTLAPGAAYGAAKRWPHSDYAKVAEYWIRRGGAVAICGSGSEAAIGDAIIRELPVKGCFNLCGKTDLFALMHIFRFSALAVTNDSGLMHLAAAMKCRGITVFGPTDLHDTGPVSDRWLMIHEREACAPCLERICPKGRAVCMEKITPAKLLRVLRREAAENRLPLAKMRRASNG